MSAPVLHLQGEILVGPQEVRPEAWVVGGRLTFERPSAAGADVETLRGWVLPGLVDAHCHVGLDAHGAVDDETAEAQAVADRDAGTLLIRDAGSPADTRWMDDRPDLPKVIRAGRHIARTRRYIRNYAWEVEPDELVDRVRLEAKAGDGWVKLVGDWIDRDAGDLTPCWPVDVLTDAGGSLRHGLVAQEAAELTHAGFSPEEALWAASWGAREWLGRPGLEEGADADLVVYSTDPRREIRALAAPEHVVLRGVTV